MDNSVLRERWGQKLSKPEHNAEGKSEQSLQKQTYQDRVWGSKFKKRHRKDLSLEEVEAIVAATKQPYCHHKDVAQRFRIPAQLVSGLVEEAKNKPEKLQQYREKELLHE